jgi:hypothetical protein
MSKFVFHTCKNQYDYFFKYDLEIKKPYEIYDVVPHRGLIVNTIDEMINIIKTNIYNILFTKPTKTTYIGCWFNTSRTKEYNKGDNIVIDEKYRAELEAKGLYTDEGELDEEASILENVINIDDFEKAMNRMTLYFKNHLMLQKWLQDYNLTFEFKYDDSHNIGTYANHYIICMIIKPIDI